MSTKVTVRLPDDVYQQAEQFAQMTNIKVVDVLKDAIELSLLPVSPKLSTAEPISEKSDEEVLKLTELQMKSAEDRRPSRLLDRRQKGRLTEAERVELLTLMQAYQSVLLRKTQGRLHDLRRVARRTRLR